MGLALRQGELLAGLRLTPFLVRVLVRPLDESPPTLGDLEGADPEYFKTLLWLLEHQIMEDLGTSAASSADATPTTFLSPTLSASGSGPLTTGDDAPPFRRMRLRRRREVEETNPLGLTFSVTALAEPAAPASGDADDVDDARASTAIVVIPLVRGGEDVPVTDSNKAAYVQAVVQYRLVARVQHRLAAFCAGTQRNVSTRGGQDTHLTG